MTSELEEPFMLALADQLVVCFLQRQQRTITDCLRTAAGLSIRADTHAMEIFSIPSSALSSPLTNMSASSGAGLGLCLGSRILLCTPLSTSGMAGINIGRKIIP
jgi:hypothetical protein